MKFLHTSDWHIGKTLKGRSRLEEQKDVLKEIVDIASREAVDAVLIAGDLYETSSPSAPAQQLVVHALIELRKTGAEVIAMAGNHDHAITFDAYRPLMAAAGIHLLGQARPAKSGGVVSFAARSTGETVNVAVLPFLTTRYAVRAAELLLNTPAEHAAAYDQQVREMIEHLKTGFSDGAVNIMMAHLTIIDGKMGGGERAAQTIFDYYVPATAFGADPHYVALGHLHRRQQMPAPCPVHYSGSPIAVDFGEEENDSVVLLVEASPNTPATITEIPITKGRRLRTIHGTVASLAANADSYGDDYLRVVVEEPTRAGLRDEVVDLLPNALEVRVDPSFAAQTAAPVIPDRSNQSPIELFSEFCKERQISDPRLETLFAQLLDALTSSDSGSS
ncbi:nuclease SbcCD subunit D [Mycobacterium kubicae]|uniref:Nuclease SbcCD subunit D n=1 Tax=Mycobacterium kubicae TaxID=120959 RepID=A0AAX1JFI7_9MYCO|nr:exonuclease SbcCD subunit D [Mycobacterium kubicae]MCV7096677.1 exonuclease SbcCD subunit D [Mycobacterium kubicae]ORW04238.1 exonuclease sbcCD subunit D [Mycobacterium kubicae]QNI11050.1 exonuclease SbcCD subunit D [Mycobacterium kubicae]QPI39262.1 exonuclease SbcCD subunit D [Mycobacterium kubicae]GFG63814.1 nuclease SbcCD subunit D [Mycobacterium kubicae]